MYLLDKNKINFRFWRGEDINIQFSSPANQHQNELLVDYTLDAVCTAQLYDYSPIFSGFVTTTTDPTVGIISIAGLETANTREDIIYIRVYGTNKVTLQRKMLYSATVLLKA